MECWLVRHGESTWNSERRFQGTLDAPLSARGRAQASALAAGLADTRFDALYTSPLSRARDTAAACAERLGLEAVPLDELREICLGDWEGLTLEAVLAREGEYYRRWLERPLNAIWSFRLANASITRVVLPAGRLLAVNETAHLRDVGPVMVAP